MTIEGKRIVLRPFKKDHLENPKYKKWMNDYDVVKGIYRPEYFEGVSMEELKDYYEDMKSRDNALFFAIHFKENDEFIGTCKIQYIDNYAKTAELGGLIGEKDYWGKGLGTDVFAAMAQYCFEELSLRKVWGGTMGNNIGMIKVFEKMGFKEEGRFREHLLFEEKYIDRVFFGCFEDEFNNN